MGSFLASYWWVAVLSVVVIIWAVSAARAAQRLAEQGARQIRPRPPDSTAPFHRARFEAGADAVRREIGKGFRPFWFLLVVGLPGVFAVTWVVPEISAMTTLGVVSVVLVIVGIGALISSRAKGERLGKQLKLVCPTCGTALVAMGKDDVWLDDHVLETGACLECGAQLIDPAEVGPRSRTLTRSDHLRAISLFAALLAGLGGVIYFGTGTLTSRREAACTRRYAAATTAPDSASVDARTLNKSGTMTCGRLRTAGKLLGR